MVEVKGCTARFSFYRPRASQTFLVGSFNNWQIGDLPMRQDKHGYWNGTLLLKPGVYQFRYLADGNWYTDFAAFGVEMDHGFCNSVLRI